MNTMLHFKLNPQRTSTNIIETMNGIKLPLPVAVSSPANRVRKSTKKSVRFSDMCKVVLIPMRHEYSAAGIYLWWTKRDFLSFRQMYITERQKENAAAIASAASLASSSSSSSSSPTSTLKKNSTILIVTNQELTEQLMSQITSVMTSQPSFLIATHEEIATMSPGLKFDAVIVDGTEDCACFELNIQCPQHSINRLSTINVIRSLSLSSNLTLFVNNSTINKESILQLCSSADIATSDLMILTPDSWAEFQLLVESATTSSSSSSEKRIMECKGGNP